jgi:hypothetical protein
VVASERIDRLSENNEGIIMTTDEIPKDASFGKCWQKKSWSVTKKFLLYVAYGIIGVFAAICICFGLIAIWQTGIRVLAELEVATSPVLSEIGSFIASIVSSVEITSGNFFVYLGSLPWWITYGIGGFAVVIVVILGYSALWCMARDLTEEDWKSKQANDFAFAALALAADADPVQKITMWYYVFRFFGAYAHYRKRVKESTP